MKKQGAKDKKRFVSHEELLDILRDWERRHANVNVGAKLQRPERMKVLWKLGVAAVKKPLTTSLEFDEGRVLNISASGFGSIIQLPSSVSAGDWCLCLLFPPAPNIPFIALGQVIWQKPIREMFVTGIEFLMWQDEEELNLALQMAQRENAQSQ